MCLKRLLRRLDNTRVIRQTQVVVCAEVNHSLSICIDLHSLSARDDTLRLVGAGFAHQIDLTLAYGSQSYRSILFTLRRFIQSLPGTLTVG